MPTVSVTAPDGLPEVAPGDDLAALLAGALALRDGDVVVVTSKVVSKSEGRLRTGDDAAYEQALAEETAYLVASRGPVRIVRTRLGLVLAAAGIDRSNVERGSIVLLPDDPDASARTLRRQLLALTGANVGVVVTDTAGRAWREGQTDIAIGVAGLTPLEELRGRHDSYGNELAVTAPAVADEIAGAAELAQGKLAGRPVAVLRGRADLVLPSGEDGPGAAALQRPAAGDLFGLGAREAVVAALEGAPATRELFGAPAPEQDLLSALRRVVPGAVGGTTGGTGCSIRLPDGTAHEVVAALCFCHGWVLRELVADQSGLLAHVSPAGP